MSEISTELLSRLVTGRKRDGRCSDDPQAKAEIVQACLQPGVSVARIGLQCSINANLLRRWIGERQRVAVAQAVEPVKQQGADAVFVPLQIETTKARPAAVGGVMLRLQVRLPNGVEFDLCEASPDDMSAVIRVLSSLPCSSSTAS